MNILSQDMLKSKHTRYIIKHNYDLNGAEIIIPEGCILDFQGGSINNGKIKGITEIKNINNNSIFNNCIVIAKQINISWYNNIDYSILINSLPQGSYINVDKDITLYSNCTLSNNTKLFSSNKSTIYLNKDNTPSHIVFSVNNIIENIIFNGCNNNSTALTGTKGGLIVEKCIFRNFYAPTVIIIHYTSSKILSYGCIIRNNIFENFGSNKEDGIQGNTTGTSRAIATNNSINNIVIENNIFKNQIGYEDGDAINLIGKRSNIEEGFPYNGCKNTLRFGEINAIINNNTFYNIPKSPVKVFGNNVKIINNKIYSSNEYVNIAIARAYESENITVSKNRAYVKAFNTALAFEYSKNIKAYDNSVIATNSGKIGEVINISGCYKSVIDSLDVDYKKSITGYASQSTILFTYAKDIDLINIKMNLGQSGMFLKSMNTYLGKINIKNSYINVNNITYKSFYIAHKITTELGNINIDNCYFNTEKNTGSFSHINVNNLNIINSQINVQKDIYFVSNNTKFYNCITNKTELKLYSKKKLDIKKLEYNHSTPIILGCEKANINIDGVIFKDIPTKCLFKIINNFSTCSITNCSYKVHNKIKIAMIDENLTVSDKDIFYGKHSCDEQ